MVKNGTPSHEGSSSYQPSGGSGTPDPASARASITRYWVENSGIQEEEVPGGRHPDHQRRSARGPPSSTRRGT